MSRRGHSLSLDADLQLCRVSPAVSYLSRKTPPTIAIFHLDSKRHARVCKETKDIELAIYSRQMGVMGPFERLKGTSNSRKHQTTPRPASFSFTDVKVGFRLTAATDLCVRVGDARKGAASLCPELMLCDDGI